MTNEATKLLTGIVKAWGPDGGWPEGGGPDAWNDAIDAARAYLSQAPAAEAPVAFDYNAIKVPPNCRTDAATESTYRLGYSDGFSTALDAAPSAAPAPTIDEAMDPGQMPIHGSATLIARETVAPAPAERCLSCNGNDRDAPCAYPGEFALGCLRDKRLSAAPAPADGLRADLLRRLLHYKHEVPTTRERAEMIDTMRDAAAALESKTMIHQSNVTDEQTDQLADPATKSGVGGQASDRADGLVAQRCRAIAEHYEVTWRTDLNRPVVNVIYKAALQAWREAAAIAQTKEGAL